jgi:hypothetical protein
MAGLQPGTLGKMLDLGRWRIDRPLVGGLACRKLWSLSTCSVLNAPGAGRRAADLIGRRQQPHDAASDLAADCLRGCWSLGLSLR